MDNSLWDVLLCFIKTPAEKKKKTTYVHQSLLQSTEKNVWKMFDLNTSSSYAFKWGNWSIIAHHSSEIKHNIKITHRLHTEYICLFIVIQWFSEQRTLYTHRGDHVQGRGRLFRIDLDFESAHSIIIKSIWEQKHLGYPPNPCLAHHLEVNGG